MLVTILVRHELAFVDTNTVEFVGCRIIVLGRIPEWLAVLVRILRVGRPLPQIQLPVQIGRMMVVSAFRVINQMLHCC